MKRKLYILGAGGFAKEVYFLAKATGQYHIMAFVDLNPGESVVFKNETIPVISDDDLQGLDKNDICLAMGVGDPRVIERLSQRYAKLFDFPNLIHPSVIADFENIRLGNGNIITANVVFTTHIVIGDFNIFNLNATVGHDAIIGNGNVINPAVNISGGVVLGNYNLLGVGSAVLQYRTIGNYSVIGACALVNKDVPSDVTVVGIPAKKIQ